MHFGEWCHWRVVGVDIGAIDGCGGGLDRFPWRVRWGLRAVSLMGSAGGSGGLRGGSQVAAREEAAWWPRGVRVRG